MRRDIKRRGEIEREKTKKQPRVILLVTMRFGFYNFRFFRNTILEHFSLLGGCHRARLLQISRKASELKHFRRNTVKTKTGGRPEPKNNSSRATRTQKRFEAGDPNRRRIRVGRPESNRDSSRATRTEQRFESGDPNPTRIRVGRPEPNKDSSRAT